MDKVIPDAVEDFGVPFEISDQFIARVTQGHLCNEGDCLCEGSHVASSMRGTKENDPSRGWENAPKMRLGITNPIRSIEGLEGYNE
jgi:hypothetical protein